MINSLTLFQSNPHPLWLNLHSIWCAKILRRSVLDQPWSLLGLIHWFTGSAVQVRQRQASWSSHIVSWISTPSANAMQFSGQTLTARFVSQTVSLVFIMRKGIVGIILRFLSTLINRIRVFIPCAETITAAKTIVVVITKPKKSILRFHIVLLFVECIYN